MARSKRVAERVEMIQKLEILATGAKGGSPVASMAISLLANGLRLGADLRLMGALAGVAVEMLMQTGSSVVAEQILQETRARTLEKAAAETSVDMPGS